MIAQSETCTCILPVLVVEGDGLSMIGRSWLTELRLDWRAVHAISLSHSLEGILEQSKEMFQQGLGKIKGIKANLHVDTQTKPLYLKAHSVPFSLKQKVEQELERLESQDVVTPVPFSEWATPIVPMVKNDGTVHVCDDYKLTTNKVSKTDMYPMLHCQGSNFLRKN